MIRLQHLEKEDLNKIVKWNLNKSADFILQWAGPLYSYPLTISQVEDYFLKEVKKDNSNILLYKIIIKETEEIIGTVELREIEPINKIGRVCRFLIGEEKYRGKGIGAEVLKEILRIGFQELNYEKITLGVFDFNHSAVKCYEKVGFLKEKLIRNARKSSTGYFNLYEMGVTRADWLKHSYA